MLKEWPSDWKVILEKEFEDARASHLLKYYNPDPRCRVCPDPHPLGYCWTYAHHVDGNPKYPDMEVICPGCEEWDENGKHLPVPEK